MNVIEILVYTIGTVFFFFALVFIYYVVVNGRLMQGPLGYRLMAFGAIGFVISSMVSAVSIFFFPGTVYLGYGSATIWMGGLLLIITGGFLRSRAIKKILGVSVFKLPYAKYYLAIVALVIGVPVYLFDLLIPGLSWFTVGTMSIWVFVFVRLSMGERIFYLATRKSVVAPASKEISLLRDEIVVVSVYTDLINTFITATKHIAGFSRDVLLEYFEYNPILFNGCRLKQDGTIDTKPVIRNIDRIPEENRIQEICTMFSVLILKLIELHSAVTSPKHSEVLLAESYRATREVYRDSPVFFDILRSLPSGVLEREKIALLPREELEARIRERTKELEEARIYTNNIIKSMMSMLVVVDMDGKIKTINKTTEELLGYDEKELIRQPVGVIFANEEIGIEDIIKKGIVRNVDKTYLTKDGKKIPVLFSGSVMLDADLEIQGIVFVAQDITERKRKEKALQEKEEFNYALFQYNPIETIAVDRGGRVVECNIAKMESGNRLPNIGDVMYKDYAGKHETDMHAELMKCIRTNKTKKFPELKYGNKFLSVTIAPFHKGAIITSQDITERKRAEEELRASETEKKGILDAMSDVVLFQDTNLSIRWGNKAAERSVGTTQEELIGCCCYELWHGRSEPCEGCPVLKALETGVRARSIVTTPDGRWWEITGEPVHDKDGEIVGAIEIACDITERKQAEVQAHKMHQGLVEAHEKLQRAYEEEKQLRDKLIQSEKLASLGQMGAKIAHEINNPLTVISGRAQIFQMMDIDEELRKTFALIERESMRINNITSTYINLSKPALPKKEKVNLNEVVEETVDSLTITGEIRYYKIYKNLQSDLPEVIGDYDRLVQVFRNLIVNASHAMAESEEKILTFQSSVSKDGEFAEVSIHDTGSGIEKEKLDKIFEIYYTTKAGKLGTGLGLVVVKDIVEKQHKGKVLVESEIGKGTTFTVQLPLKIERKRKRILIADDEAYTREVFVTFLEKCDMEVFEACNGTEALENFEKVQPDIVLSDIVLPVMDGFELVEEIRSRKPEQKIILMTGFYYEPEIKEKLERYNVPFFTKPADLDAIWKMISDELKK